MPNDGKICSFDCLYCEAGFNAQGPGTTGLPSAGQVRDQLYQKLKQMHSENQPLDVITFSGNGEPTLHPQFLEIINDTIELRNQFYPQAKVSVLSNATRLADPKVVEALLKVDNNILKLDSAINSTAKQIDRPASAAYDTSQIIDQMAQFNGHAIMQTLLVKGEYEGKKFDNTTSIEIDALINAARRAGVSSVMLYSIDRKTPAENLQRIPPEQLAEIASKFHAAGIPATTA